VVFTEVTVAGQLLVVLDVPETGLDVEVEVEAEAEALPVVLDQAAQLSCAETPVAATARAAEVVNFISVVLY